MAPKIKSWRETEKGFYEIFIERLPDLYNFETALRFSGLGRDVLRNAKSLATASNQLRVSDSNQVEVVAKKILELENEISKLSVTADRFILGRTQETIGRVTRLISFTDADGNQREGRSGEPFWLTFKSLLKDALRAVNDLAVPINPPVKGQIRDRRPNPYPLALLISCAKFWEENVERLQIKSTLELTSEEFEAFCVDVFDLCLTEKAVPHSYWQHFRDWRKQHPTE